MTSFHGLRSILNPQDRISIFQCIAGAFYSLHATGVPAFEAAGLIVASGVVLATPVVLLGVPAALIVVRPKSGRRPAQRMDGLLAALAGTFFAFRGLMGDSDGSRGSSKRESVEAERARADLKPARNPDQPDDDPVNAPGRYLLFGFVSDPSGQPIADAEVIVTPRGGRQVVKATTGPDGGYELVLPFFSFVFDVSRSGYLPIAGTDFTIEGSEPARKDFRLVRGAVLAGRVVDAVGQPVAGAAVYRIHAEHQIVDAPSLENVTVTNEQGEYAFPGLPDGTADLGVRARGHLPALKRDVTIAGLNEVRHDFTLESGRAVVATVEFRPTPGEAIGQVVVAETTATEV